MSNELQVWYGPMPESNGRSNFTAILHKGDLVEGHTIARSEYPERVRYEADRVRYLIGELNDEPYILDYDADKHSGYAAPKAADPALQADIDGAAMRDVLFRALAFYDALDREHDPGEAELLDAMTSVLVRQFPGCKRIHEIPADATRS